MTDAYKTLRAIVRHPNFSLKEWAAYLDWVEPSTRKADGIRVHRSLVELSLSGLVRHRGDWKGWVVTARGREVVNQIKELP